MILVGGPDWPTSVLTGILNLPPAKMLMGTLPVQIVIAPCCCAGAMMLKKDDSATMGSMAVVALTMAALAQTLALVGSGYFIEECAAKKKEFIMSPDFFPDDEEVKAFEIKEAEKAALYKQATRWEGMPGGMKLLFKSGAVAMTFCCHATQFMGSRCFVPFALTDSVKTHPKLK